MRQLAGFLVVAGSLFGADPDESACSALAKMELAGVDITSAAMVAAVGAGQPGNPFPLASLPANCMVRGVIDQRMGVNGEQYGIGFELRLPADWEGRFLFQGGGGMDGVVRDAVGYASGVALAPGLARGFAVAFTDAGHEGHPPEPQSDSSFSRDQQARIDNAYRSIERVTTVSKSIVSQYYGEAWKHSYLVGCSNGGRQGLIAAQRFPTYFDGIVSAAPAFRVTRAAIGSAWETIAFTEIAPKDAEGRPILSRAFSDGDLKLVADAVLRECDAKDGLSDGMVFNTAACRFDPSVLTCQAGKTDACLSAAQVSALEKVFAGPSNSRGEAIYSDWPWDPGIAARGWRMLKLGTSPTSQPNSLDTGLMFSALKGYFMTPYDPDFDPMKFDFDKDPAKVEETAALQDATWTELSTFSGQGGKLILTHGMADPFFSANDTERYYRKLAADNGGSEAVSSWARLFLIPGMNHCLGGPALDSYDALGAVVAWVEKGEPPARIQATGTAFPGRSRPLCAYPAYASYKGNGSPDDAASFVCQPGP